MLARSRLMALPIPLPLPRHRVRKRRADHHYVLHAVALAAVVLAPSHLASIGPQVLATDAVVNAHLSATEPGKE